MPLSLNLALMRPLDDPKPLRVVGTRFPSSRRRLLRAIGLLPAALVLGACVTGPVPPQPSEQPASSATLAGAAFELMNDSPRVVAATIGNDGRAHVLAMAPSRDVYYLIVGPGGVQKRDIVLRSASGSNVAIGFDHSDQLHAVIGNRHMVLRGENWTEPEPGPACARLMRAGKTLICAFLAEKGPSEDSRRVDYYSTVLTLGLPIPIPVRNRRLLLACESTHGWLTWAVVDPGVKRDTEEFAIATSDRGTVGVLYTRSREVIATIRELAFARTPGVGVCEVQTPKSLATALNGNVVLDNGGMNGGTFRFDVATDPATGDSLGIGVFYEYRSVKTFLVHADSTGSVGDRDLPNPPGLSSGLVRIAPAGDNRFHVLMDVKGRWRYVAEVDGEWSRPIDLDAVEHGQYDVAQIVSAASNRALAIWPEKHSLKAQWIELGARNGD